jgi:hypothetical protein
MNQLIDELRERIARLEAAKPRRRVYNQQDAARELGMSVNKFRREQKEGRVKGTLTGAPGSSRTRNCNDTSLVKATPLRCAFDPP